MKSVSASGKLISFERPLVMGILNITDDSFYDGGWYTDSKAIRSQVGKMINEKADIIDIGAMSSKPGSSPITEEQELERLQLALSSCQDLLQEVIVSIDTYRSKVVKELSRDYTFHIVNDISGGDMDPNMFDTVAASGHAYIMMHMEGTPSDMQDNPTYSNVTYDILVSLKNKLTQAHKAGLRDVIIDVGFGFGKTVQHNYTLLSELKSFQILGCPILAGISRKSMIYKLLDISPKNALNGTSALHMAALLNEANMLRVHDVKEAVEVVTLYEKLKQ